MSELLDETVDAPEAVDTTTDGGAEQDAPVARADEPDPAPPSAPSIDLDDPAVQAQIAGMSQQQTLALLEQLGLVSYQDDTPAPPDPLSDNFAQEQAQYIQALLERNLAPINEYFQAEQAAKTNQMIDGALTAAAEAAKLDNADAGLLRSVAQHFASQPQYARLGATQQGVEATAKAAAEWLAAERKSAGEAAVAAYKQQISGIHETPAEPSGAGGGLAIDQKPKTYDEIIAKHIGRVF